MLDAPGCRYEVVVLAGGECKRLYPLTGGGGAAKALLPVGNRPLLYYSLRHLAEAGIKTATVVSIAIALRIAVHARA
jgi:NDP-sugar pyrophosphorylase family protein